MKIDQNGLASVANAAGFTAEQQAEITGQNSPSSMSFSGIVGKLLAAATAAMHIIVDTFGRKVHANSGETDGALYVAATTDATNSVMLRPVAGQTGRSLEWEVFDTSGDAGDALNLAVRGIVNPARHVMTVDSLVTKIIGAMPDGVKPIVRIDQEAGRVEVYTPADAAARTAALNGAALVGDFKARVSLTEPAAEPGVTPLKFEGGAF